jgi:hypothetical protein
MISLHIRFPRQGWQWPMDQAEFLAWTQANELIATLPARLVRNLIEIHLAGAMAQNETARLMRRPVSKLAPRPPVAPSRLDPERRKDLRVKRRRRKSLVK